VQGAAVHRCVLSCCVRCACRLFLLLQVGLAVVGGLTGAGVVCCLVLGVRSPVSARGRILRIKGVQVAARHMHHVHVPQQCGRRSFGALLFCPCSRPCCRPCCCAMLLRPRAALMIDGRFALV
jgi:hypothetical protein